jgi:hypothetical protein
MNNCQGAQYLKRRAFKLNSRHKLVFNVQHQDGVNETLSAKIFASAGGMQHSKIKVSIMPLKGNAPASYKAYSDWTFTQHYVITFISVLRQVGGFLRVFQFPPPIKLIVTI